MNMHTLSSTLRRLPADRPYAEPPSAGRRLFAAVADRLRRAVRRRATYRALMVLDDHQLMDIGLMRADVKSVADGKRLANVVPQRSLHSNCVALPVSDTAVNGSVTSQSDRQDRSARAA